MGSLSGCAHVGLAFTSLIQRPSDGWSLAMIEHTQLPTSHGSSCVHPLMYRYAGGDVEGFRAWAEKEAEELAKGAFGPSMLYE
eukprot:41719-Eustigmatos_ZCMA.PRE.1